MVAVGAALVALAVAPAAARAQDDGPDGEVVGLLQQLIRTNTSNPPGNEQQVAELLQRRLAPLGFETLEQGTDMFTRVIRAATT